MMERTEMAPITTAKPLQSSCASESCVLCAAPNAKNVRLKASSTSAQATEGTMNTSVPAMPNTPNAAAATKGPNVKPSLPPTAKMLMPVPFCAPATKFARRPPSGWNIATPMPLSTAEARIRG